MSHIGLWAAVMAAGGLGAVLRLLVDETVRARTTGLY
jgi:fluoride ion exporter CrcB/FEX